MLRAHIHLVLPALIAIGAFTIHADVLEMPLLGQDGYAAIIASRIQNFSDFAGTFSELMMDGRLTAGDFYRPMGNLSLAIDYSLWGMQTRGYQLTSMLAWFVAIVALYLLTRRLLGGRAWLGPALAASFFALHPATLSILPYPARRTEALMLLFVALALLAVPSAATRANRRRQMLGGLFALFAVAAKESGIIAVPLIFLHQLTDAGAKDLRHRIQRAVVASVPAGVLCGLFLIGRYFVVGGIGGYHIGSNIPYPTKLLAFGPQYLETTFCSGAFDVPGAREPLALAIVAALGVMAFLLVGMERAETRGSSGLPRSSSALMISGAWFAVSIGLACASFEFSPRYAMPITFSAAMLLGALVEGAVRALSHGRPAYRAAAGFALTALAAVAWVGLNGSALHTRYPELRRATRIQDQLLEALTQRIGSSSYEYIDLEMMQKVPVAARAVDDMWMIAPWGLQAWLELAHPDRPYQLKLKIRSAVPSDEYWLVTLNPQQSGG